jgi:hypothetical protein
MTALSPKLHEVVAAHKLKRYIPGAFMINHKTQATMNVAALGGYLEGLSFLSKDSNANFASAYEVDATNVTDFLPEIISIFEHLPDMELDIDERFRGGIYQLEQVITSYLLVDPHIEDEKAAENMRKYLSFKVMDRIDIFIGGLNKFEPPKRIIGRSGMVPNLMVFYLLTSPKMNFVLQFSENHRTS